MARSGEGETFAVLGPPGVRPVVNSIFDFSAAALAELRLWLEQNPPAIGISNILGFSQFSAQIAPDVHAADTTSSTSYVDLANVGPEITGLPSGEYVLFFGCFLASTSAASVSSVSLEINGAVPDDNDRCGSAFTTFSSVSRAVVKTLALASNDVKCQYRVDLGTATGTFALRWLFALKYANK